MNIKQEFLGYLCAFLVLVIAILVWVIMTSEKDDVIINLLKRNVTLATGVDFKTGQLVALNPLNSQELLPCDFKDNIFIPAKAFGKGQYQSHSNPYDNSIKNKKDCAIQIIGTGDQSTDRLLQNALVSSEKIIDGKVRVKGKDKDARFVVTITALYEGSFCTTTFNSGKGSSNCTDPVAQCAAIRAAGGTC